jgi:hypothetical protein
MAGNYDSSHTNHNMCDAAHIVTRAGSHTMNYGKNHFYDPIVTIMSYAEGQDSK